MLGILTGLAEEAKLAARAFPEAKIALSYAQEEQGRRALQALLRAGATELLSFGCAGGLDPTLQPGAIIVPDYVYDAGKKISCDGAMRKRFGAGKVHGGGIFHSSVMIGTAEQKRQICKETGCCAVDMESGIVAQSGLPFAVLRVICDDASRDLPPAAASGLKNGKIFLPGLIGSLFRRPSQLGALMQLGKEAGRARRSMADFLRDIL
ncbi:hypothetical protein PT277_04020 [Acetobacteraceae bacterium ESL0709]|nr:hypothetical protein [Acetobacteraceae bacterium ESL0697]MDF7677865.1 hypothetical protein [Acetobacteraceae bacterium ESL0709]